MPNALERIAFHAAERLRRSWFRGHWLAAAALDRGRRPSGEGGPGRAAIDADLDALVAADWAAVEAGHYLLPASLLERPGRAIADSRAFLMDLPKVARRRREQGVREAAAEAGAARLPSYYRQNFHFQTGGWLTAESARLYDFQVEVLFAGAADAMRRGALPPLGDALRRAGPGARMADLACGTGRFLEAVKDNWPRTAALGFDLSAAYLAAAARRLAGRRRLGLVQAPAERLPLADGSLDAVTCIYLFHELPPRVRTAVAAEIARVLRPGGRLVLVDALQTGDHPPFDPLLARFPAMFHEPYFGSWLALDLPGLFGAAGLSPGPAERRFLSATRVFDKPAA
ncbi:class I SAM-dependent methyltransferase [Stella sp.]|uniref:class I SAM-dependent methyltransferase n=1 Tax=Stella sp. TaxID=2912054 RepID=UPI0035AE0435